VAALLVTAAMAARPAQAERDVVHFANSIDVAAGSTVHDAVCFLCSVHVHGTVNGDIVAFFGSVQIDGEAKHDVVNFFGGVQLADGASIGHDLVNFFGTVRLGENSSVGRDMVAMFGWVRAADSVSFGGDRVTIPAWIFWGPLLLIFCAVSFVISEFRRHRQLRYMRGY
jgi:hypothetical protein